jgi:hypothetical protein
MIEKNHQHDFTSDPQDPDLRNHTMVTDQDNILTYDQYWQTNLAVICYEQPEELEAVLAKHPCNVSWTKQLIMSDNTMAGLWFDDLKDLTVFMLIHPELHDLKYRCWAMYAKNVDKEIQDDIEYAQSELESALEAKNLYQSLGAIGYQKHIEKQERSTPNKLKKLLWKIRNPRIVIPKI